MGELLLKRPSAARGTLRRPSLNNKTQIQGDSRSQVPHSLQLGPWMSFLTLPRGLCSTSFYHLNGNQRFALSPRPVYPPSILERLNRCDYFFTHATLAPKAKATRDGLTALARQDTSDSPRRAYLLDHSSFHQICEPSMRTHLDASQGQAHA